MAQSISGRIKKLERMFSDIDRELSKLKPASLLSPEHNESAKPQAGAEIRIMPHIIHPPDNKSMRRTKTQIYLDIMRSIQKADGRLKRTHIVYKANLTHARLDAYLDTLISNEFIAEEKNGSQKSYVITKKGRDFLSETTKLKELSDAFGIPLY